jgi:murein DD-endopeptidase MepM/ murein hydrolase activator NlpD
VRRVVARLGGVLAVAGAAALVAGLAGAAGKPATEATAAAVRILILGQSPLSGAEVVGPPSASTDVTGFSYPDDGSVVRIGSATGSVATQPGASASAEAVTNSLAITLFGGEIAVGSVSTHATAAAGTVTATADTSSSQIQGLVVLGQDTPATTTTAPLPLADWGTLELLVATNATETAGKTPKSAEANVIGMRLKLLADHGGLPAGSEIEIGVSRASAVEGPEGKPLARTSPAPKPAPPIARGEHPERPIVEPGSSVSGTPSDLVRPAPTDVQATLSTKGYVFPVYGPASFGDTFGAPRPDLVSGWHHGEDIFAPLGTPLLAVADGVVHTVGWNEIGGWRLWLRDGEGDEFYYAHLSAYSPLAAEGKHVHAGDVLGFLGKTGDAEGGLPHLHFEIHPRALVSLGYDGVIAPYPYLVAWKRAQDVPFAEGRVYVSDASGLPRAGAPAPGAVLLQVSDVSQTSGLVPGGLERALNGSGAAQGPTSRG